MEYLIYICSVCVPLAILAQATDLLAGHCGRAGVGAALFAALGGYCYAAFTTRTSVGVWSAVALSVLIVFLVAGLLGTLILWGDRERYLLSTVALQLAFVEAVNNLNFAGGPLGVSRIPAPGLPFLTPDSLRGSLVLSVPALLISTLLLARLLGPESAHGRILHWTRDDMPSAQAFAVPTQRLLMRAFCLHAVLAGLAGVSIVIGQAYVSPQSFDLWLSLQILTVVYLSGTGGHPFSMFIGAGVLIALTELMRALPLPPEFVGPMQQVLISGLLVSLLVVRRRGLFGPAIEAGPSASRLE